MDSAEPSPPKKPRRKWLTCLIAFGITFIGLPLLAFLLLWGWLYILWSTPAPPLVISKETTYVTGPLTEEGFIDFFKALEQRFYPPELAADENGYRDFVRLFGIIGYDRKPDYHEFYRLQLYEKLGLDPNILPTLTLPDIPRKIYEDFHEANGEKPDEPGVPAKWEETDIGKGHPWTLEQYPMLADWINEIDEPLDAIAVALRKPVFYFPLLQDSRSAQSGITLLMSECAAQALEIYKFSREIVENFQARANYRIGQGDIDGAIDDTISIMRLVRHYTRAGGFLLYSFGSAFEAIARTIPVCANPEHPLTEQQIRRFLAELDALPARAPFAEAIEWERYTALSAIQFVMLGVGASRVESSAKLQPFEQNAPPMLFTQVFDWNVAFRRMNEAFDAMHEPLPRTKLASIVDDIDIPNDMGVWYLRMFYSLLIPGNRDAFMANSLTGMIAEGMSVNRIEERMLGVKCSENM